MIDKEKVVRGLKACGHAEYMRNCDECPYAYLSICRGILIKEALQLLEEQEKIIAEYHKADSFLATHRWKWDEESN